MQSLKHRVTKLLVVDIKVKDVVYDVYETFVRKSLKEMNNILTFLKWPSTKISITQTQVEKENHDNRKFTRPENKQRFQQNISNLFNAQNSMLKRHSKGIQFQ